MNRLLGFFVAHLTVDWGEGGTSVVVALYVHMSGRLRSMASFDSWESRGAENAIGGESSSAPAPSPLRLPDLQGVLAFAVPASTYNSPGPPSPPLRPSRAHFRYLLIFSNPTQYRCELTVRRGRCPSLRSISISPGPTSVH